MNSNPLREVMGCDLTVNCMYCTENGDIIQYDSTDGNLKYFSFLKRSELRDGELVSMLDNKVLDLFWRLTKNNFNRTTPYEGDSD